MRAIASTACATTWPPRSATCAGFGGQLIGFAGVLGVLLHGGRDLLHRGGGLFQAGGLLLGALRQVGGAGGDLARGVGYFGAATLDFGNDARHGINADY